MVAVKVWSEEDQEELIDLYLNKKKDIVFLAEHFGKNTRSIVSKLVQLRIYTKPEKPVKAKTVKMLINELEVILDVKIDGVNLSKKPNLEILVDAIKKKLTDPNIN